jgi:hypothetical protein
MLCPSLALANGHDILLLWLDIFGLCIPSIFLVRTLLILRKDTVVD